MNNEKEITSMIINEIDKFLKEVGDASNSPLPAYGDRLPSIDIEQQYDIKEE